MFAPSHRLEMARECHDLYTSSEKVALGQWRKQLITSTPERTVMSQDIIAADKVVLFKYTLTNPEGEVLDASGDDALPYLHGHQNIVPGLERQLEGKKVGDKLVAVVPPEEGYGMPSGMPNQKVPREAFPPDAPLQPGMGPFFADAGGGQLVQIFIAAVADDHVDITTDHPLAGVTLTFDVEITRVREALPVEIEHGHPHGADGTEGHHH